jgi:SAM-dependent methyltransferase
MSRLLDYARRLVQSRQLSHLAPATARAALVSEPWFIDRLTHEGDELVVEGWAFPDPELPAGTSDATRFELNGVPFAQASYPLPRTDVGDLFWQRRNAAQCGFRCVTRGSLDTLYPGGELRLTFRNPGPARKVAAQQSWFIRRPDQEPPFPDADRRYRVIGNRDFEGFRQTGYTDFRRLEEAAKAIGGRRLEDCAEVLDWGVGCGRISRYLGERVGARLTGCDIDADNVRWCSDHLPGRFVVTGLKPPLPFGDGEFDLVIGLSVFTHFREPLQDAWLAELARVTREGAILLMTVHGETALDYAHLAPLPDKLARAAVAKAGLLVGSGNDQLDGFADHEGEYVNVFHATSYIRERWARHFEVLDVLPGYIFTHDLVVLRKRGAAA